MRCVIKSFKLMCLSLFLNFNEITIYFIRRLLLFFFINMIKRLLKNFDGNRNVIISAKYKHLRIVILTQFISRVLPSKEQFVVLPSPYWFNLILYQNMPPFAVRGDGLQGWRTTILQSRSQDTGGKHKQSSGHSYRRN